MLYERYIVNAADGRVRVLFLKHGSTMPDSPNLETGNHLSNCEQPAFPRWVDDAPISLPQGCGSPLRLAMDGRGVIATKTGRTR